MKTGMLSKSYRIGCQRGCTIGKLCVCDMCICTCVCIHVCVYVHVLFHPALEWTFRERERLCYEQFSELEEQTRGRTTLNSQGLAHLSLPSQWNGGQGRLFSSDILAFCYLGRHTLNERGYLSVVGNLAKYDKS